MATGQKNISIGTSDNAQDGITLREAFRRIRKNFAEIYGDTDSDNLTDTETVTETNFESHIVEKIQDTVVAWSLAILKQILLLHTMTLMETQTLLWLLTLQT